MVYKTEREKETERKIGKGVVVFFMVIFLIFAIVIIFINSLDFKTLYQFGPRVYFNNIISLELRPEFVAKRPLPIYKEMDLQNLRGNKLGLSIPAGRRFKVRGDIDENFVTWVAIETYNGPKLVTGFILLEDEWDLSDKSDVGNPGEPGYRPGRPNPYVWKGADRKKIFFGPSHWERVSAELDVKHTSDSLMRSKLEVDSSFIIVRQSEKKTFYVSASEGEKLDKITQTTGGDERHLQINLSYNPQKDGVYQEPIDLIIVDSIWTKIAVLSSPFLLYIGLRIRRKRRERGF